MSNGIMHVEHVFDITGRGAVISGKVISGGFRKKDNVIIKHTDGGTRKTTIRDIALINFIDHSKRHDHISFMLTDIEKMDVNEGDVIEVVKSEQEE